MQTGDARLLDALAHAAAAASPAQSGAHVDDDAATQYYPSTD